MEIDLTPQKPRTKEEIAKVRKRVFEVVAAWYGVKVEPDTKDVSGSDETQEKHREGCGKSI